MGLTGRPVQRSPQEPALWILGNRNCLTARRTLDLRTRPGAIRCQFLLAIGTIKNDIHKPFWSDRVSNLVARHSESQKKMARRKTTPTQSSPAVYS